VPQHFALFLVGSVVITVVPGADMALITRQVVTRGRGAAHATIFGNLSGLVVHALALAVGLSALLVASATAYTTVDDVRLARLARARGDRPPARERRSGALHGRGADGPRPAGRTRKR
jgi:hypothetical protein